MSLADKKRDVFTTIGSYNSLMEDDGTILKQTDIFSSINNKDEVIPYVLDILKNIAGTEALKEIIGGMFTKLLSEVEPKFKTALKKQFIKLNADDSLPVDSFVTNGIVVPVKTIDSKNVFKSAPSSESGNLIYGSTDGFNAKAYDAILNNGTDIEYNNLSLNYDDLTDSFNIKHSGESIPTIGEFFEEFIDGTELINKKEVISNVMDNIYGSITKSQDKTTEQVFNDLQIDLLLEQVLDGNDSLTLSPEKNDELHVKSKEIVKGIVNYNMGCGLMPAELNIGDLSTLVSNISGSTDQFYVGNQIENTIDDSTNDETDSMTKTNKQTIKDGFFQKVIKSFSLKLLEALTTAPQIRVLLSLMSSFENNGVIMLDNAVDDMKKTVEYIKCMAKEILNTVVEYIFNITIGYLISLLQPIIKIVVKEKINQYTEIISSLSGVLNTITKIK